MSSFRSTGADVTWTYVDNGAAFACRANGYKLVAALQRRLGLTADGAVGDDLVHRLATGLLSVTTRFASERDDLVAELVEQADGAHLARGAAMPRAYGEAFTRAMLWYAFYQPSSSAQEQQVSGHDIAPSSIAIPADTAYPLWGMPLAASTARGTCTAAGGAAPASPPSSDSGGDLAALGTYLYGGPTTTPLLGIDDTTGTGGANAGGPSAGQGAGSNAALGTYLFGPPTSNPLIGIIDGPQPQPRRSNTVVLVVAGAAGLGLLALYLASRKGR